MTGAKVFIFLNNKINETLPEKDFDKIMNANRAIFDFESG